MYRYSIQWHRESRPEGRRLWKQSFRSWGHIWVLSSALCCACPLTSVLREDAPSKQLLLLWRFPEHCLSFSLLECSGCLWHWAWMCQGREDDGPHGLPCSLEQAWRSTVSVRFLLYCICVLVIISFWGLRALQRLLVWSVRVINSTHRNKKGIGAIVCL